MKEIEDNTNRWKNIPCSCIGRINIVKMTILPKARYRLIAIPIELSMVFFTEVEQIILNFVWRYNSPQIAKTILRKKNRVRRVMLPGFRLYYKATVFKTVQSWHKKRQIDKWNKIESPEINPCTYGQLIYDKGGMNTQWRKDNVCTHTYTHVYTHTHTHTHTHTEKGILLSHKKE